MKSLCQKCRKQATFNLEGSKTAAYCEHHAEDGMVDVCKPRCNHNPCLKRPTYNVKGNKKP
ncbi:unnamed protein product, partial [Laminaria digitata]